MRSLMIAFWGFRFRLLRLSHVTGYQYVLYILIFGFKDCDLGEKTRNSQFLDSCF